MRLTFVVLAAALAAPSCSDPATPEAARQEDHRAAPDGVAGTGPHRDRAPVQDPFEPYIETIPGRSETFDMVPIPAGRFTMGSPVDEPGRKDDEGPRVQVQLAAFWMGKCEVTWDEYLVWSQKLDLVDPNTGREMDDLDGVSRPTPPYVDMTFGMGELGYPAISMTQKAAKGYCVWLSKVTGHYYRLPTEAEWEYACRAGSETAWSFGADPEQLGEYAWFGGNSKGKYARVGTKKPNAWGLHDMHGNVCEWTLDRYVPRFYGEDLGRPRVNPLAKPTRTYPRVVRGGSYLDRGEALRSPARRRSHPDWKRLDPQIPKSVWYHTNAQFLGFRVVRPLRQPTAEEKAKFAR